MLVVALGADTYAVGLRFGLCPRNLELFFAGKPDHAGFAFAKPEEELPWCLFRERRGKCC